MIQRHRARDAAHLAIAAENGWIWVTHDRDFLRLHQIWMEWTAAGFINRPDARILRLPAAQLREEFQLIDSFLQQRPSFPNELWDYDPRPTLEWYRPPA